MIETIIPFAMILMPISVGYIFIQLVVRAINNTTMLSNSEEISRAITRLISGVAIGIAYHMIATTLANAILRETGASSTVELWRVEVIFLAMVLPAVFLLARESRRMKSRGNPVAG